MCVQPYYDFNRNNNLGCLKCNRRQKLVSVLSYMHMLLSLINDLLVQLRRRQLVMGETLAQICQQSCTLVGSVTTGVNCTSTLHSILCYLIVLFFR